jgi:hypothetical protein
MKLKAVTDPNIMDQVKEGSRGRVPVIRNLIQEFHDSPYKVCKVDTEGKQYKSPTSLQASLQVCIKRAGYKEEIGTRIIDGEVYLRKKNLDA